MLGQSRSQSVHGQHVILGGGRREQDTFALDRRIEEQSSGHSVRQDMLHLDPRLPLLPLLTGTLQGGGDEVVPRRQHPDCSNTVSDHVRAALPVEGLGRLPQTAHGTGCHLHRLRHLSGRGGHGGEHLGRRFGHRYACTHKALHGDEAIDVLGGVPAVGSLAAGGGFQTVSVGPGPQGRGGDAQLPGYCTRRQRHLVNHLTSVT